MVAISFERTQRSDESVTKTVLLSFEGTSSRLDSRSFAGYGSSEQMTIEHFSMSRYLLIVENCIVKNFHVSNMKAVRARISVRVRMQFQRKRNSDGLVGPKLARPRT